MKNRNVSPAGIRFTCGAVLIFLFSGCGGAGSIKGYRYATTKYFLQKAVMTVIKTNPNIYRDSTMDKEVDTTLETKYKDSIVDLAAGPNFYNDGIHYVTITIKDGLIKDEFTLGYYGDQKYWKTSPRSAIAIIYAHHKDGKGGRDAELSNEEEKKFTDIFESQFVVKINEALHLEPTTD